MSGELPSSASQLLLAHSPLPLVLLWCLHLLIGWFFWQRAGQIGEAGSINHAHQHPQEVLNPNSVCAYACAYIYVCVFSNWEGPKKVRFLYGQINVVIKCIHPSCIWYACVYVVYRGKGLVCVCVCFGLYWLTVSDSQIIHQFFLCNPEPSVTTALKTVLDNLWFIIQAQTELQSHPCRQTHWYKYT